MIPLVPRDDVDQRAHRNRLLVRGADASPGIGGEAADQRERRAPNAPVPEGVDLIELASEAEPAETIEDLVSRRELGRAVARAMAMLPDEQRTAIVLKEYHGLTFQEIAELLDCPLSTVKTRLYQGLTVLRRQLAQAGVESVFSSQRKEHV